MNDQQPASVKGKNEKKARDLELQGNMKQTSSKQTTNNYRKPITLYKTAYQLQYPSINIKDSSSRLTISKVHTLRTHTFNLPLTPSMPSSSTPSHQHLLAGFLQNRRSFWAIPMALLFDKSLLTSVRSFARARLQITARLGSWARWPQVSSLSKPLVTTN